MEIEAFLSPLSDCWRVFVDQTTFDDGSTVVLQLDCVYDTMFNLLIWICLSCLAVVFLSLFAFSIWWYFSRHQKTRPSCAHFDSSTTQIEDRNSTAFNCECQKSEHRREPSSEWNKSGDLEFGPRELGKGVSKDAIFVVPSSVGCRHEVSVAGGPLGVGHVLMVSVGIASFLSAVIAMNCLEVTYAKLVLYIPPDFDLHSLKLFFHKSNNNTVTADNWMMRNGTHIQIYDLPDASPTESNPCSGYLLCPNAFVQNLVGCDSATGQCVCERGYAMENDLCIDVDECMHGPCSPESKCENTIGSFICHCRHNDPSQVATDCRSNCRECDRSEYEVEPCTTYTDRLCLHPAHPVSKVGDETMVQVVDGLKILTSENVFHEDLHNARNLETTYYVTDTTQASDFYWDRESGLRVNIGIHNVHLIPEYGDVEHDGDNKYMLRRPNDSADKMRYQRILDGYCRHPIPDHYNIMLEISRNRTTAAKKIVCNSSNSTTLQCPSHLVNGDTYLHRSLNDACTKLDRPIEPLQPATNSIICMKNSSLLSEVFNLSYAGERFVKISSSECRAAERQCASCLNQCYSYDIFDQKCCLASCYSRSDCRHNFSRECATSPEECASGDVYRYTIEAVFRNIEKEFRCHIQHQKLSVLYELFFFVQIPKLGFETQKFYHTVYAESMEYQRRGDYMAGYLTVEHSTELDLEEDFVLRGYEEKQGRTEYSIQHLSNDKEDKKNMKFHAQDVGNNGNDWMVAVEFERPFDYSTSTWVSNGECEKDVRKIRPISRSHSDHPVSLMVLKSAERFLYFLKTPEKPPFFRFTVPANTSVLSYHFQDQESVLLLKESLSVSFEAVEIDMTWKIHINGKMTGCPSYLGIRVNNRLDLEELCHYDLLILCPPEFNITFSIPRQYPTPLTVTYDVQFYDASKNYTVFLTAFAFEESFPTSVNRILDVEVERKESTVVVAILLSSSLTFVIFFIFYMYIEFFKKRYLSNLPFQKSNSCSISGFGFQAFIVGGFVIVRVAYGLTFTFSILSYIFAMLTKSDVIQLLALQHFQLHQQNTSAQVFVETERVSRSELFDTCEAMTLRLWSCSRYVDDLRCNVSNAMAAAQQSSWVLAENSSISAAIYNRTQTQADRYSDAFLSFVETYKSRVFKSLSPLFRRYREYLRDIFHGSSWLSYPMSLFNLSRQTFRGKVNAKDGAESFSFLPDFGLFLEIDEIEDVSLWFQQFLKRFNSSLPTLPLFPHVSPTNLDLGHNISTLVPDFACNSRLHLMDTFRFFTSLPFPSEFVELSESSSFTADVPFENHENAVEPSAFRVFWLLQRALGTSCLWISCLFLDFVLLTYRVSHICLSVRRIKSILSYDRKGLYCPYKKVHHGNGQVPLGDDFGQPFRDDILPLRQLRDDGLAAVVDFIPTFSNAKVCDEVEYLNNQTNGSLRAVLMLCLTSKTLPKVLVVTMLIVVFYTFSDKYWSVFFPEMLKSAGILSMYVLPIANEINLTHTFVLGQINLYQDFMTTVYQNQLQLDLLNLQSFLQFFNLEQGYRTEVYFNEVCSLFGRTPRNASCDMDVLSFPTISVPILPCNFLPVRPQFQTGYKMSAHKQELLNTFEPFASAITNIFLILKIMVLVAVAIILFVNLFTWMLFQYFQVYQNGPSTFCIPPTSHQTYPPSGSRSTDERSSHSVVAYQPASTRECFESEVNLTEISPSSVPQTTNRTLPSHFKPRGRLVDVGYSETNV